MKKPGAKRRGKLRTPQKILDVKPILAIVDAFRDDVAKEGDCTHMVIVAVGARGFDHRFGHAGRGDLFRLAAALARAQHMVQVALDAAAEQLDGEDLA